MNVNSAPIYLIIGTGFAGSVVAECLASAGHRALVSAPHWRHVSPLHARWKSMVIQELAMRLTEEQRKIIREAGLRHFGVIPHLFGSRLNDAVRGGDIDLFIPGDWPPREAIPRRLRFCAELHRRLGEQKIDVVVENKSLSSSTMNQAIRHGQPV